MKWRKRWRILVPSELWQGRAIALWQGLPTALWSVRLMHYGNYGYSWEDAGMELQRYRTFHFHTK